MTSQSDTPNRLPAWQLALESAFGVFLPIGAFVIEPGIFTGRESGLASGGMIDLRVGVILSMTSAIPLLVLWLAMPMWRSRLADLSATLFLTSGCLSAILGVLLLRTLEIPLSFVAAMLTDGPNLFGLLISALAILAVFPFGTALVYVRHSLEAFKLSYWRSPLRQWRSAATMGLAGILLVGVLPLGIQVQLNGFVEHNVREVVAGTPDTAAAVGRLRMAVWCSQACYRDIVQAIVNTDSEAERNRLQDAYRMLMGREVITSDVLRTTER